MKKKSSVLFYRIIVLGILIVVICCAFGFYQQNLLSQKRDLAISRGLDWLIENKDSISAKDSFLLFGLLYKVVPDEETAQKLLGIAKEKGAESILESDANVSLYQSNSIERRNEYYAHLITLLKRKCLGENIDDDIAKLNKDLSNILPIGDLQMWYVLNEFSLRDNIHFNQEVTDTYTHYLGQPVGTSENFLQYFVTHVLLYESDYFSHRLDSKRFTRETDILNRFLNSLSNNNAVIRANVDIISEVLYSLQALNQKPNRKINGMYKGIIEVQNEDGSWNQIGGNPGLRFHSTAWAVLALTGFPQEPRSIKLYCLPY